MDAEKIAFALADTLAERIMDQLAADGCGNRENIRNAIVGPIQSAIAHGIVCTVTSMEGDNPKRESYGLERLLRTITVVDGPWTKSVRETLEKHSQRYANRSEMPIFIGWDMAGPDGVTVPVAEPGRSYTIHSVRRGGGKAAKQAERIVIGKPSDLGLNRENCICHLREDGWHRGMGPHLVAPRTDYPLWIPDADIRRLIWTDTTIGDAARRAFYTGKAQQIGHHMYLYVTPSGRYVSALDLQKFSDCLEDRYCSRCGNLLNPGESDPCDWCQANEK